MDKPRSDDSGLTDGRKAPACRLLDDIVPVSPRTVSLQRVVNPLGTETSHAAGGQLDVLRHWSDEIELVRRPRARRTNAPIEARRPHPHRTDHACALAYWTGEFGESQRKPQAGTGRTGHHSRRRGTQAREKHCTLRKAGSGIALQAARPSPITWYAPGGARTAASTSARTPMSPIPTTGPTNTSGSSTGSRSSTTSSAPSSRISTRSIAAGPRPAPRYTRPKPTTIAQAHP